MSSRPSTTRLAGTRAWGCSPPTTSSTSTRRQRSRLRHDLNRYTHPVRETGGTPPRHWSITAGGDESSYYAARGDDWHMGDPLLVTWLVNELRALADEVLRPKEVDV